ncbi:MAG: metal-dependent hydrolase [Marinobacter sp.]|uniref:metal-dependent hydrolase n=1 Tax=Marinobacter sp. TaxID=50741 RepID=UPI00299D305E|nr:metal-dependent hydrolase [Marinobacter sp.]MDX1757093.1 metal-dependent hydrolase [Marinobacter sp.]
MPASAHIDKHAKPIPQEPDNAGIPVRRLVFDIPEPPRYFLADNATATTFITVLSAVFPPGERFFIESVRRFRDRIADPELKAAVRGFIGQEAIHGREHDRLNELLIGRGLNTRVPELGIRGGLNVLERCSASQQLACTALMEHFTALLGEVLLEDDEFQALGDSDLLQLFLWHALEELEHKAVTYDVYSLVANRRWERWLAFPLVTATLVPPILVSWAWLMWKEGKLTDRQDLQEGLTLLFGRKGLVSRALGKMGLYARSDFHPDKKDTRALVAHWRERLFGEQGTLTGQVGH